MNLGEIQHKISQSVFWLFADSWWASAVSAICVPVLAALLGPEVFGTMALAWLIFSFPSNFSGSILTESLLQRETLEPGHIDATFWLNTGTSALISISITLATPWLSALLNSPALGEVLPTLALIAFLGSLSEIQEALFQRDLEYKKLALLDAFTDIPYFMIAIGLAASGFGIWSLVLALLTTTIAGTAYVWIISDWRPGFAARMKHIRDMFAFNRDTLATNLISYFDESLPGLALGYFGGERALGVYDLALKIGGFVSALVLGPFQRIAFTVVARLQTNLEALRAFLDKLFRTTTFIGYPAVIGAILLAPTAAPLILGPEWTGVVLPLQIAFAMSLRSFTGSFNIPILRGVGWSRPPIFILLIGVAFLIVCGWPFIAYGAAGIALLVWLRALLTWPISARLVSKAIGYPAHRQFVIGWRAFATSLAMAAAVYALDRYVMSDWPAIFRLAALVLSGSLVYFALYALIWPQRLKHHFSDLFSLVFSKRKATEPDASEAVPSGSTP